MTRMMGRSVLLMCGLMMMSCNTDMFNEEDYKKLVEAAQPVNGIDESHTWELTTTYDLSVTLGATYSSMSRLQILSANPATGQSANLLGDYPLSGNVSEQVSFVAPCVMRTFYAALVDSV